MGTRIGQLQQQLGRGPAVAEEPSLPHSPSWPASHQSPLEQHRHVSKEGEGKLMQLGRARLTQEQLEGRCFYCGESGHLIIACLAKRSVTMNQATISDPTARQLTKVKVMHSIPTELEALKDSGADENLMDWGLAEKLGLISELVNRTIKARSLNGKDLFTITHITEPFEMHINNHRTKNLFASIYTSHHLTLSFWNNHGCFAMNPM